MPQERIRRQIERLVRATPQLIAERSLDRVLQLVADLARELLEVRYAAIGLLNPDRKSLASFVTSGLSPEERTAIGPLPTGRGILGLVIHEGRIVRLKDLAAHPQSVGFPANHPPMKSFLGVPVVGRFGVLGDLYLTEKIGADEFTDGDEYVALLLAATVASAVENAQAFEQNARLLAEVQELHRSRERFFSMVNHELRNALAGVYGWAQMLVRKKDPATVPRGAFEIVEAAEEAIALVNDLLDLSRLDEDRLKPVLAEVECCEIVSRVVQRFQPAAVEKNVVIEFTPQSERTMCLTDGHRTEQILVNLFTNALRHTPTGSTITVTPGREDRFITITVRDQGPGVQKELVEQIFDIYYTTAAGDKGGSGVGLPLSRRLARLMGGDLKVIPGSDGGVFVLRLPLTAS